MNYFHDYMEKGWVRLLEESLASNGVRAETLSWNECSGSKFKDYDGVMLSGSQAMASEERTLEMFSRELEAVKDNPMPLVGICFGHQLLSRAFGCNVVRAARPTARFVETEVLVDDTLLNGLRGKMAVYESHHEVVETVPEGFRLLARSATSAIDVVKHRKLPLYGVQFHPERNSSLHPDGALVMANFIQNLS